MTAQKCQFHRHMSLALPYLKLIPFHHISIIPLYLMDQLMCICIYIYICILYQYDHGIINTLPHIAVICACAGRMQFENE